MATLSKRGASPYWQVRVQRNGREFWRSTRETHRGRAEARAVQLLQAITDEAYGRATPAPDRWLTDWWTTYWGARVGSVVTSATAKTPYIESLLGMWRLRQLRPSHLAGYIARRRLDGAADSTISLEGRLIRQCLRAAVDEGLLPSNPAASRVVQWPAIAVRAHVLSAEDEATLQAFLPPDLAALVTVSLHTGLRGAEAAGLCVEQIVWEGPALRIVGKGGKRREVPLFPQAVLALRVVVGSRTSGRVWPSSGSPALMVSTTNKAFLRAWRAARRTTRVPTTHMFRHTFATRFLRAGGDIYILSKILGHSSVAITEKVYAHLLAGEITARALSVQIP